MRRKKDDKRVLRRGNGNYNQRKSRLPAHMRNNQNQRKYNNQQKKQHNGKTVLIMILILIAFIIGAGAGVLLSFDNGTNSTENETHIENVTVEMTSNLNNTTPVVFEEADSVDFNENQSSEILGAEDSPYYRYEKGEH